MIEKHIRLHIDFTITIAEQPPCLLPGDIDPPEAAHEYDARQARLLEAVKAHPDVLKAWLHSVIAGQMHSHNWYDWDTLLMGRELSYQDLLTPAIATLSKEDRDFFSEGHHLGYFEDYIDLFQQSFTIVEDPPRLVELPHEQRAHVCHMPEEEDERAWDLFCPPHLRDQLREWSQSAHAQFLIDFPPPIDPQEENPHP